MAATRCAASGCGRFVRRGSTWCARHEETFTESDEAPDIENWPKPPDEFAIEFQRRLATGEYRALFGDALNDTILGAAEDRSLADEIGILRIVLARLLLEERDPAQLATSVSQVARWPFRRRGRSGRSAASRRRV